jgi:hypothetical protein
VKVVVVTECFWRHYVWIAEQLLYDDVIYCRGLSGSLQRDCCDPINFTDRFDQQVCKTNAFFMPHLFARKRRSDARTRRTAASTDGCREETDASVAVYNRKQVRLSHTLAAAALTAYVKRRIPRI